MITTIIIEEAKMIPNPSDHVESDLKVVCNATRHVMRVTSFDTISGELVERCSRCGMLTERKAFFATSEARARYRGKIGDKIGRDAAKRFAGKMHQSKRKGQHPATRKR